MTTSTKVLVGAVALLLSVLPLGATTIDFELGGPCGFVNTSPLTNQYAGVGAVFSGPSAGLGGAVLNQCSNFNNIAAHSGVDFLAFNDGSYAQGPEWIQFSTLQSSVSIWAAVGASVTLAAYDSTDTFLGSYTYLNPDTQWQLLSVSGAGIDHVILSYTGGVAVWDDLTYTSGPTVPEPSTLLLLGGGLLGTIARMRKR